MDVCFVISYTRMNLLFISIALKAFVFNFCIQVTKNSLYAVYIYQSELYTIVFVILYIYIYIMSTFSSVPIYGSC